MVFVQSTVLRFRAVLPPGLYDAARGFVVPFGYEIVAEDRTHFAFRVQSDTRCPGVSFSWAVHALPDPMGGGASLRLDLQARAGESGGPSPPMGGTATAPSSRREEFQARREALVESAHKAREEGTREFGAFQSALLEHLRKTIAAEPSVAGGPLAAPTPTSPSSSPAPSIGSSTAPSAAPAQAAAQGSAPSPSPTAAHAAPPPAGNYRVLRVCQVDVRFGHEAEYDRYLEELLPQLRSTPGVLHVEAGRGDSAQLAREVVIATTWESYDALVKVLGEKWPAPVIDPTREAPIIHFAQVRHYRVAGPAS
jgi:quinol monooxygenase YgiN